MIPSTQPDKWQIRYLERLYDHEQEHPVMGLNDQDGHRFLTEECGLPYYHALDVPRALATLGLVTQQNGRWWLLDAGRQHVTRIRAGQENQADRLRDHAATQAVPQTYIGSINGGAHSIAFGTSGVVNQHVNSGIDPAAVRELVAILRPELVRLGDAAAAGAVALDEIEQEAHTPQPDRGRVRQAPAQILEIVKRAGTPLLQAYVTREAEKFGILPPG